MSYVFGATLALAGISEQQSRNYGPPHPQMCIVCREVVESHFHYWLQGALARQREEVHVLWNMPLPFAHVRLVVERHDELRCS